MEQVKKVSANGDLDQGIEAEKGGFATAFGSEDAREGISAFLGKRKPSGRGSRTPPRRTSPRSFGRVSARCALSGAGISVPSGIPDFRTPGEGIWEKVDPMAVATIDAFHRDTRRFWEFYRPRFHALSDEAAQSRRTRRSPSSSGAASSIQKGKSRFFLIRLDVDISGPKQRLNKRGYLTSKLLLPQTKEFWQALTHFNCFAKCDSAVYIPL